MREIPLVETYMDDEIQEGVKKVLDSRTYILGENLKSFEEEFADFCGVDYAVGVSSGTAALHLALLSLGIGRGDEVIVPSASFIATATPIFHVGAEPVFCEVDPITYTIDPADIEKKVSDKTKAIIPVHLYGHPADMEPIIEIREKHDLFVIEDACQAHGAEDRGKKTGSIGDIGCFSFYPSKVMTVCGDGGMITTKNPELAERVSMLRNQGRKEKYIHDSMGFNYRMSEVHAAVGRVQLKKLPEWLEKRRTLAEHYFSLLKDVERINLPSEAEWAKHSYYMYVIRVNNRDELKERLGENGIGTGIHYPVPIHLQPCMVREYGECTDLDFTEKLFNEVLSLPMHPMLNKDDIEYIVSKITQEKDN